MRHFLSLPTRTFFQAYLNDYELSLEKNHYVFFDIDRMPIKENRKIYDVVDQELVFN